MIIKVKNARFADLERELKAREEIKTNFNEEFVKRVFQTVDPGTPYISNWHVGAICEYLQAMYTKQIMRLIINLPPRMTKSIIISVAFTAWLLGRNPSERILAASGVQKLATRFNANTREVIQSQWYQNIFSETKLKPGENQKTQFETTKKGHRISVSFGTTVVGEGGRWKLIDDPLDPDKAFSAAELENKNNFYKNSWSQRSDNHEETYEILTMQRVHRNDLTGLLQSLGGWDMLIIPQEAEGRTKIFLPVSKIYYERKDGEFLFERRFGKEAKTRAISLLGTTGYKAQHQQKPVAMGGNLIDENNFPRYNEIPARKLLEEVVMSADTASKAKEISNPTAILIFGRLKKAANWLLLEVVREKLLYPKLKNKIVQLESKWLPNVILVEDKSSGTQLIQEAKELGINTMIPIEPDIDKVGRMERELAQIENGLIELPNETKVRASWLHDFISEITDFPQCLTMDQIDSLSQFLKWLREKRSKSGKVAVW